MATASEASQQANRSAMDPKRLAVLFYLIAAIVVGAFFAHLLGLVFARAGWPDPEIVEGIDITVSGLVGFLVAVALAVGAYTHPRTHGMSVDVASELMRVTWPTWGETRVSTIAVVVASVIAAVILFFIDTLAYNLMVEWIPAVWGKL
jgi:preprotein translocase subunit SecE